MKRQAIGAVVALIVVGIVVVMTLGDRGDSSGVGLGANGDASAPEIDVEIENGAAVE